MRGLNGDAGVIQADAIFLPWLCGPDGMTVHEVLLPHLRELNAGGSAALLEAGG
jgi:hypothetical protein